MSDPKPLEELLQARRDLTGQEIGYTDEESREMARRLRALDERHQAHLPLGTQVQPAPFCKACGVNWPCPDRQILDGKSDI